MAGKSKVLNILLLGETGIGKSTLVNAFINYVRFRSLNEAVDEPTLCPVPVNFVIEDINNKSHAIKSSSDDANENVNNFGESATLRSRSYLLTATNYDIRLIDTPGMGDTRGQDQDKANLKDILEIISSYQSIHAIVVILKAGEHRMTPNFKYCITKLFAELHCSAAQNIMFVFTNGRGPNYKPGETLTILQELLKQISELESGVELPLSRANMFVVDNEALRYLYAVKNGVEFPVEEVAVYNNSWEKSSKECRRLFQILLAIEPHFVHNLVSINKARNSISLLQHPLFQVLEAICDTEAILTNHKAEIEKHEQDIDRLRHCLYVPEVKMVMTKLAIPQTVCKSDKCKKTYEVHGIEKPFYPQVCCRNCYVEYSLTVYNTFASVMNFIKNYIPLGNFGFLRTLQVPQMSLNGSKTPMQLFCKEMSIGGKCKMCGCPTDEHELEYYNCKLVEEPRIQPNVEADISNKTDILQQKKVVLDEINSKKAAILQERNTILLAMAHFSHFLDTNAIVPYSDVFEQILDQLSQTGREIRSQVLDTILNEYKAQKAALRIKNAGVTSEDIDQWLVTLAGMKVHGQLVRSGLEMTAEANRAQQKKRNSEKEFEVPDDWFRHSSP